MQTIKDVGPNLKSFYYHACEPEDASLIRGSVVVLHGADGYGGRYGPFGDELAKNGYAMYAIDHIGHGMTSLDDKEQLGKWKKDDFYLSAYNVYYLVDNIKLKYPGKPVYLLGDDYGGTMAQYMIGKFPGAFDGVIVASCGMPTSKDASLFLSSWIKKVCLYDDGKDNGTFRKRTSFLNGHFKPTRTKYDWLNSDPAEVDRFIEDPKAGFVGSVGYYYYQYKYIMGVPRIIKFDKINKELPVMFIGGGEDYITHRGKQIEKLKKYYEEKGFVNTECKIYDSSRHDVLLDVDKTQVAEDIADFINKNSYHETTTKTTKEDDYKVITLKEVDDKKTTVIQDAKVVEFEEEDPDDLKLSSELKK